MMADISDVQNALVAAIAQIFYPQGTAQASAVGYGVRIFAGWPSHSTLASDIAAGTLDVAVFPGDRERNTGRMPMDWQAQSAPPAPTITASVSGQTVTFAGTIATGQTISVIANGIAAAYALQANDSLASIATAIANQLNAQIPASNSGAILTLPTASTILARVGTIGTSIREVGRQSRDLVITLWAASPAARDLAAQVMDGALRQLPRLALPDGSCAQLSYLNSPIDDGEEKEQIYRRKLRYAAEFPTTQLREDSVVTVVTQNTGVTAVAEAIWAPSTLNTPLVHITNA